MEKIANKQLRKTLLPIRLPFYKHIKKMAPRENRPRLVLCPTMN